MDSCETYKNLSTANIPGFEVIFDNSFITLANTVFNILMVRNSILSASPLRTRPNCAIFGLEGFEHQ